ncbi:MAG: STAS domain-containing protein [Nocardioidaceae bacterium]
MDVGLEVHEFTRGDVLVLSASGEIDLTTAADLSGHLRAALNGDHRGVVVDLGGVRFMDSTGISVLLNGNRRLRRAARGFAVACPPGAVARILETTALTQTLGVRPTVEEAAERALAPPDA